MARMVYLKDKRIRMQGQLVVVPLKMTLGKGPVSEYRESLKCYVVDITGKYGLGRDVLLAVQAG